MTHRGNIKTYRSLQFLARFTLALAAAAAMGVAAVRAEDSVVGAYDVTGVNARGATYAGVAQIVATGQTYRIAWKTGPQTFHGMGVATSRSLAFVYVGGPVAGVVLYERVSEDICAASGQMQMIGTSIARCSFASRAVTNQT